VFDLHSTLLVNQVEWDSIYYRGNPKTLFMVQKSSQDETAFLFSNFELLMRRIKLLQKTNIIDTIPSFDADAQSKNLTLTIQQINNCYMKSVKWIQKYFNYYPRFIKNHFYEFFSEVCR